MVLPALPVRVTALTTFLSARYVPFSLPNPVCTVAKRWQRLSRSSAKTPSVKTPPSCSRHCANAAHKGCRFFVACSTVSTTAGFTQSGSGRAGSPVRSASSASSAARATVMPVDGRPNAVAIETASTRTDSTTPAVVAANSWRGRSPVADASSGSWNESGRLRSVSTASRTRRPPRDRCHAIPHRQLRRVRSSTPRSHPRAPIAQRGGLQSRRRRQHEPRRGNSRTSMDVLENPDEELRAAEVLRNRRRSAPAASAEALTTA